MTGLRVLHVVPGDLGKLLEWDHIIDYAATGGTGKKLESGAAVFNAIWISPFFERTGAYTLNKYPRRGSLYAIKDHLSIDPAFSSLPADDPHRKKTDDAHLKRFCQKAEKEGVRILADLVLNHVATDHPLAIAETQDIQAIRSWGKDVKLRVKQGKYDFECYPDEIHPERGEYSIVGVCYVADGDYMPGTKQEDGRTYYPLLFSYGPELTPKIDSSLGQAWSDVAKINYKCEEARELFVGLWKEQIQWLLKNGVSGFRCDAAYKIAPDIWSEVIQFSHDQYEKHRTTPHHKWFKHPIWVAETLGGENEEVRERIGKATIVRDGRTIPAFDNGMLWTHWWKGQQTEYAETSTLLQSTSRFGGLGVPDNHDTETTLAEKIRDDFKGASSKGIDALDITVANYSLNKAVMSLILGSTGICMEYGYLRCVETQPSIFDEPDIFEKRRALMESRPNGHNLNLEERMWRIVNYFDQLAVEDGLVPCFNTVDFAAPAGNKGGLLRYSLSLSRANKDRTPVGEMTVFINRSPELGPDHIEIDDPQHAKNIKGATRLILGPKDPLTNDHNGQFMTVYDVAIYTNLHHGEGPTTETYSRPSFRHSCDLAFSPV